MTTERELTDYLTLLRTEVKPIAEARDADRTLCLNAFISHAVATSLMAFGIIAGDPEAVGEHPPDVLREILRWHRDNAFDRAQNLGVQRPRGTDAQLVEQAHAALQELGSPLFTATPQTVSRALVRRILATMLFAWGWLDDLMTRPRLDSDPPVDEALIHLVGNARAGLSRCIVVLFAVGEIDLDTESLDD